MSGAMLHGLGDCTPELNCGCLGGPPHRDDMDDDTDELTRLRAENARLRETVADYEQRIAWDTTCARCSDVLEASYDAHVRAERATARIEGLLDVAMHARSLTDRLLDERLGNERTLASARALRDLIARVYGEDGQGPLRILVDDDWLIQLVDRHTCGTGPGGHYGAHEPHCGMIPIIPLSQLSGWAARNNDLVERVAAEAWARSRDDRTVRVATDSVRKVLGG